MTFAPPENTTHLQTGKTICNGADPTCYAIGVECNKKIGAIKLNDAFPHSRDLQTLGQVTHAQQSCIFYDLESKTSVFFSPDSAH